MNFSEKTVFAAIDIGTSQMKVGVYSTLFRPAFQIIGYRNTVVHSENPESATCRHSSIKNNVAGLLNDLSLFLRPYNVESLCIGLCGLVSSYLVWDKITMCADNDSIPIWLDRSCTTTLDELFGKLGDGKDIKMLGTHLPKGANWLLSKIYHQRNRKLQENQLYLQIADAIFAELTGSFYTHFSSQVSIVHNIKQKYSLEALEIIHLDEKHLPEIQNKKICSMLPAVADKFNLPAKTYVVPALSDFYASFLGIGLKEEEGFILANTSEISGKVMSGTANVKKFVKVKADGFNLLYGSTNTGGNIINWVIRNLLNKDVNSEVFHQLNEAAYDLRPEDTPLLIPFIDGERSPLWDNDLSGSFIGLKSFHNEKHFYHAALESIAFCRRFQFEAMPGSIPEKITICGGSTKNKLLNKIRATVLQKELLKSSENELAIYGTIRHAMTLAKLENIPVIQTFESIFPDPSLIDAYNKKYESFKKFVTIVIKNKL